MAPNSSEGNNRPYLVPINGFRTPEREVTVVIPPGHQQQSMLASFGRMRLRDRSWRYFELQACPCGISYCSSCNRRTRMLIRSIFCTFSPERHSGQIFDVIYSFVLTTVILPSFTLRHRVTLRSSGRMSVASTGAGIYFLGV